MMRATIARKLIETTIEAHSIKVVDGEPKLVELPPLTLYGNFNRKEALRELKRVHGKAEAITISKITSVTKQYEISVDEFVKYAKVVEAEEKTN